MGQSGAQWDDDSNEWASAVFLGEFEHAMDDKGRLVLPRKFRDELAEGCVLTKGQDGCLYIFSLERWDDEVERLGQLARTNRVSRKYQRSFFASAQDQTLDKQGRIQIAEKHRTYSGLEKDVVVIGANDRIELWSPESWEIEVAEADEIYGSIEEELVAGGGI